jgi:perosamine synthetase
MAGKPIDIPLSTPVLDELDIQSVVACLKSGWVSAVSPTTQAFEAAFAECLHTPYALATQSGTAALHLALMALDIGPGDEVIVPALTFIATVNPVRYVGATPVFVDVDPATLALDPAQVAAAITPNTRAILVTHLYGRPAPMDALIALARQFGLFVIEDASESLGATLNGQPVGTLGTIGCFSFNGNKLITTGGGGMAITQNRFLAMRMRHLACQARVLSDPEFVHDEVGYNYRMSGVQAALGLSQLEKMPTLLAQKRAIAERYRTALSGQVDTRWLSDPAGGESAQWLSTILLRDFAQREHCRSLLADQGIESRPLFQPLPLLAPYQQAGQVFPVAVDLWQRGLCLPSSAHLTPTAQGRVIAAVSQACSLKSVLPVG